MFIILYNYFTFAFLYISDIDISGTTEGTEGTDVTERASGTEGTEGIIGST